MKHYPYATPMWWAEFCATNRKRTPHGDLFTKDEYDPDPKRYVGLSGVKPEPVRSPQLHAAIRRLERERDRELELDFK